MNSRTSDGTEVYDVTKYLDDHPGGDDVLLSATGRDSTEDFEDAGHSSDARKLMEEFFIGEIDTDSTAIPELEIFTKDHQKSSDLANKFLNKAVQYWAFPAAAIGIPIVVAALLYSHKR
ncbi:cytochrome b5-like isoform X2 [Asparagus officinalis]|uniref:cytochrome b5-like isoform X2 n=1 Tax=Asparagus officinalis TaxID=4686 RepID=UPI00098E4636|nr:cytochrome b5-like isoform X2 [Asparagus officinalis]